MDQGRLPVTRLKDRRVLYCEPVWRGTCPGSPSEVELKVSSYIDGLIVARPEGLTRPAGLPRSGSPLEFRLRRGQTGGACVCLMPRGRVNFVHAVSDGEGRPRLGAFRICFFDRTLGPSATALRETRSRISTSESSNFFVVLLRTPSSGQAARSGHRSTLWSQSDSPKRKKTSHEAHC